MEDRPSGAPAIRPPRIDDFQESLALGARDFFSSVGLGLFFASFYVFTGMVILWVTYQTGHTLWLTLAVLGFPIIGAFAAIGFYETSRRRMEGEPLNLSEIAGTVWSHKNGQLPLLAVIFVVLFLFWFFLGHMIFALFLGLSPMKNVFTSLDVYWTSNGLAMLAFGTAIGAVFSAIIFSMSVLGIPMLLDRDVDFITALATSMGAVMKSPLLYLLWGAFIAIVTMLAMSPMFLGLFIVLPILGHATWHLYQRVTETDNTKEVKT